MHPGQYIPFSQKINNVNLIIYPVKDENPLSEVFQSKTDIINHLNTLYEKHHLNEGRYHILFVWNLEGHRMTDVWIHKMENWSAGCGPLLEVKTFKDLDPCNDAGIASGDSIITLGREEELRRAADSIEEYLDRSRAIPQFPEGFKPDVKF